MRRVNELRNVLIGATAVLAAGGRFIPGQRAQGPVLSAAQSFMSGSPLADSAARAASATVAAAVTGSASGTVASDTRAALDAFSSSVRQLSDPHALDDAFRGYFAYKTAHPDQVTKPYLYFVDYGLPSTTPRGYVFDMEALKIVDGPFTVAHGRGSSTSQYGTPTHFSNGFGSNASSLGLYVTRDVYDFHGNSGGQPYTSIGMRLQGVSTGFNDNALARRVVAHGAPYVTPSRAGRSEGCPAMEQARAHRLLPELANGSMVFLFAPDSTWLSRDPWLAGSADAVTAG